MKKQENRKPKITAVVPLGFGRSLESLQFTKEQIEPINVIIEEGPNPSRNRNTGAKKANTEFVAFINAHTLLPKEWSKNVSKFFEEYLVDIIGGPQLTAEDDNYFSKVTGYALNSKFGASHSSKRYGHKKKIMNADERHLTSANLICKAEVLEKIQFDEDLYPGEDPKFISDAKNLGFKVAYSPDIPAYHRRRNNLRDFVEQIFGYGKTRPQKEYLGTTIIKHPSFTVPSLFLIYLVLLPILVLLNPWFLAPIILYLVLNLISSTYIGIKNLDLPAIFLLPFIFLTIHIIYGLGFIYGTLKR